ncbi:polyprenyl synthetase family protein [Streptomyces sp. SBT349]|uniref:polyprenyl synthetase family protein n=1 Tax=Streptomyces sp. SBT349 TaxID=1580539 RepID=UPI00099CA6BE|nr:polyprenyl synthetase family protein [Streptomyces sp. SBT349]
MSTGQAMGAAEALSPREATRAILVDVERTMESVLADERARWATEAPRGLALVDTVGALVAAGGKRLRPAFCVSGFLSAGGDPTDPRLPRLAAGLELLHVSALLHDDILDCADQRRGQPSAHVRHEATHRAAGWRGDPRRYGESVAILAGDLALVYADQVVDAARDAVLREWTMLRSEMMVGQFLDVTIAAEYDADPDRSRWVAVCKSGSYSIHRPLSIGAQLAGRSDLAGAFQTYGAALGEAFQLRDDLIDAFGDDAAVGKPTGLDFEQQKMTLLLALAIRRDARVRKLVLPNGGGPADGAAVDTDELRGLLISSGIRDEVEAHIDTLVAGAVAALDDTPLAEPWRRELTAMAHEVAYRDR